MVKSNLKSARSDPTINKKRNEIRPINVPSAAVISFGTYPVFIPGGTYQPEKFPALEDLKRQFQSKQKESDEV